MYIIYYTYIYRYSIEYTYIGRQVEGDGVNVYRVMVSRLAPYFLPTRHNQAIGHGMALFDLGRHFTAKFCRRVLQILNNLK